MSFSCSLILLLRVHKYFKYSFHNPDHFGPYWPFPAGIISFHRSSPWGGLGQGVSDKLVSQLDSHLGRKHVFPWFILITCWIILYGIVECSSKKNAKKKMKITEKWDQVFPYWQVLVFWIHRQPFYFVTPFHLCDSIGNVENCDGINIHTPPREWPGEVMRPCGVASGKSVLLAY